MNVLRHSHIYVLFSAQGMALSPIFLSQPPWLVLFWAVSVIWRILIQNNTLAFPNIWVKALGLLLGLVALFFSFSNLLSIDTFVCFFVIATSLKAMELRNKHDGLLLVTLNFMCLAVGFLFYQQILMSIYVVVALVLCLQAWVALFREREVAFKVQFYYAAKLVLQTLPIMLILFLAMPRLGPLWQMPSQSRTGVTGISDSMSPGEFGELIQSNEIAFRAGFNGGVPLPKPSDRYWRGLVFEQFDGRRWSRGDPWHIATQSYLNANQPHPIWKLNYDQESTLEYQIMIEPHQRPWLYTLMAPVQASSENLKLRFSELTTLEMRRKLAARASYSVVSALNYVSAETLLTQAQRLRNLKLPVEGNVRSRRYAETLRAQFGHEAPADKQILNAVLEQYAARFYYTLKPPILTNDVVDQFLFDSQRGFCEHFSSSFVYLMRAAGIPARVVVGYQGGDVNPLENYIVVRQRDAHAWAEVWIAGQGWLRVDPTAAVAPQRIERGVQGSVAEDERSILGRGFSGIDLVAWMQLRADLMSFNWHKWVLSYDSGSQQSVFKRLLGGGDAWRIALFFIGGSFMLLAMYFASAFIPRRMRPKYPQTRAYGMHLKRLARAGFEKPVGESPMQFAERIGLQKPAWRVDLVRIAYAYNQLTYRSGGASSNRAIEGKKLQHFMVLCKQWRPDEGIRPE